MDEGILIYAHNNELIDYARMAYCCALLAKYHLDRPVCLITDQDTWDDFKAHRNRIDVFDDVQVLEQFDPRKSSRRNYGSHTGVYYHNRTRHAAYHFTPFEKTLVLDADYLILDDRLKYVWELEQPMMANRCLVDISEPLGIYDQKLSDITIPLYWATVFYFEKTGRAEEFFARWRAVSDSFDYYAAVFNYRSSLYRNDFAFSAAEHATTDYSYDTDSDVFSKEPFCRPLPIPYILTSRDEDEIVDIDKNGILMKTRRFGMDIPCKVTSSFHCTNKISLRQNLTKIVELYE